MAGSTSALYAPLIERDLDAVVPAVRTFRREHTVEELWQAVTRFAVLAYAPSQHSKRAVMSCLAAHQSGGGEALEPMIVECARYAASSRQPWSEPPILEPPSVDPARSAGLDVLRAALEAGDRPAAEAWLAARLAGCEEPLREIVTGDARLMLDTAIALDPLLGGKGRFALFRMVVHELFDPGDDTTAPLAELIDRAIDAKGAVDAVRAVFVAVSRDQLPHVRAVDRAPALQPYPLGRDFAQTLVAHAIAGRLPGRAEDFLGAVHENLEHGESFADWSFA